MRNLRANHARATSLVVLGTGLITAAAAAVVLRAVDSSASQPTALVAAIPSPAAVAPVIAPPASNPPDMTADPLPPKGEGGLSTRLVDVLRSAAPASSEAPHDAAAISALAANGIPATALNAYRVAAARLNHDEPGCRIDWALLAGIGRVESDHGQFAGAVLHVDGTSTPKVIGPALNGHGDAYIPAPSNGVALDGDAQYTHALGPMQFIPQTWAEYGTDANGDGVADVFNIDDAALGAARYLCAAGGDLGTHAGQVRAVFAYNHSDEYVAEVLALAAAYRSGIPITGLPVGNVSGALKPAPKKATPPPVDPGHPIGATDTRRTKAKPAAPVSRHTTAAAPSTTPTPLTPAASSTPTLGPDAPSSGASDSAAPTPSTSAPTTCSTPTPTVSPSPGSTATPTPTHTSTPSTSAPSDTTAPSSPSPSDDPSVDPSADAAPSSPTPSSSTPGSGTAPCSG